jgi:hypothetical protein
MWLDKDYERGISMTRHLAIAAAGFGACALGTAVSYAQPAEGVNVDVAACLELETREAQLECYEARVQETLETRGQGTGTSQQTTSTTNRPAAARAEPPLRSQPLFETFDESDDIVARVTSVREVEPHQYMIELDNGQVWKQNRPKRYNLRVDAEVRLYPTHWGSSYRLTDPEVKGFIQVERLQ